MANKSGDLEKMKSETVTTTEAIKLLGVTRITLFRWRKSGEIPFIEFPKRTYRYYKTDITRISQQGL